MDSIKIKPSAILIDVLKELSTVNECPKHIKDNFEKDSDKFFISSADIRWCHEHIKSVGLDYRMSLLLKDSEIILPEYIPPPRNPVLEARCEKLRKQQNNRRYNEMTKNVNLTNLDGVNVLGEVPQIRRDLREINRQLINGAQYIISVIGTFFAIFVGLGFASVEVGSRLLAATFCAVIVGIAEMYFIIKYDIEEEKVIDKKNN